MKPVYLFVFSLFLFTQCNKPTNNNTTTNTTTNKSESTAKQEEKPIVWENSYWSVINIYDETNKKEHAIAGTPYALHLAGGNWTIKLDKNKCNSTYTLSEAQDELTVAGMGCTRICCDADAGKALATAMATENVFRIENAVTRNGWVLLKSPKLTLRLKPVSSDSSSALKPSTKAPQNLTGIWFPVHAIEGGKTVHKYEARKFPISFYDGKITVKLDVNDCFTEATFLDNKIICPADMGMSCTKMCCDEIQGLTIFKGDITYKFKDDFLILSTATGYQLWLQR